MSSLCGEVIRRIRRENAPPNGRGRFAIIRELERFMESTRLGPMPRYVTHNTRSDCMSGQTASGVGGKDGKLNARVSKQNGYSKELRAKSVDQLFDQDTQKGDTDAGSQNQSAVSAEGGGYNAQQKRKQSTRGFGQSPKVYEAARAPSPSRGAK